MKSKALFIGVLVICASVGVDAKKLVIAHRGASGYLPEHSMSAKAMAYAMGVDYIEQDVVMTKDDRLVVLHDRYLDRVTNVAELYSDRARKDGRYYVIDFTLEEIQQLEMTEGFKVKKGQQSAIFPQRFPLWKSSFRVHTFEDEIEMIQGLNDSTGNNIGIYPEIKAPAFFRHEGKDISKAVLRVLKKYGYISKFDRVYVQCFDSNETKRIHDELFPEFGMEVNLVQLLSPSKNHEFDLGEIREIAKYADGIGPHFSMIVKKESTKGNRVVTDLVREAHDVGLVVHPYTFRADTGYVPGYAEDFEDLLKIFYCDEGVDGVFTDFPDRAVEVLKENGEV